MNDQKPSIHQHQSSYSAFVGKRGALLLKKMLDRLADHMIHVHPNTITWISLIFALAGALAIVLGGAFLILGALLIAGNLVLDLLDGIVARKSGLTSARGDFLDKMVDRLSDTALLFGIACANPLNPYPAFLCASALLFSSYLRLFQVKAETVSSYAYQNFFGRGGLIVGLILVTCTQGFCSLFGFMPEITLVLPFQLLDIWASCVLGLTVFSCWSVAGKIWASLS